MRNPIPKAITLNQYTAAIRAFWAVLEVDPSYLYFPVILDGRAITAPAVPATDRTDGRAPGVLAGRSHPQGDEFGEYACMVTIEVVE